MTIAYTKTQKHLLSLVQTAQAKSVLLNLVDAAKQLKVSRVKVLEASEDMGLNVNVGIGGPGGHGKLPQRDWTIEDLNAPYNV